MFFALKVFSKFFSGNREHGVLGGFGAFFCSGCPSLGFPLEFRYISVLPPMILRYFFDHSSIAERRMNGERTENERRTNGERTENERRLNGEWTEVERRLNGARTEVERSLNGARTELERSSNGGWTELERSSNGGWTELERRMNGAWTEVERSSNGGWTEDERRMNGERSKTEWRANGGVDALSQAFCAPSVWYRNACGIVVRQNGACFSKLTSAKLQREKAKSKFSANLWHFESAERWKWKYKANNGSPVNPCVWLFE